jgi:hypothetical protein
MLPVPPVLLVSGDVLVREPVLGVVVALSLDLVASVLGGVPVLCVLSMLGDAPVLGALVPVLGDAVEFGFCVVALVSDGAVPFGDEVAALPGLSPPVPDVCA